MGLFVKKLEYKSITLDFPLENEDGSFDAITKDDLYEKGSDFVQWLENLTFRNGRIVSAKEIAPLIYRTTESEPTTYYLEEVTL